jgi:xanthine/uracil permease
LNLAIYGAIAAYLLPVLYSLLGACARNLRLLSQQLLARTYEPSYATPARVSIAMIGGLVVGLFTNFGQPIFSSLSPLAIAFIVGYGVEVFFSYLDAILNTLRKKRAHAQPVEPKQ